MWRGGGRGGGLADLDGGDGGGRAVGAVEGAVGGVHEAELLGDHGGEGADERCLSFLRAWW